MLSKKILLVHNFYESFGGEDRVVLDDFSFLRRGGHFVEAVVFSSGEYRAFKRLFIVLKMFFSIIDQKIKGIKFSNVDVVHIHNTFPVISPFEIEYIIKRHPNVVITMHNFRTACSKGTFFRCGAICERCLDGKKIWSIYLNCRENIFESIFAFLYYKRLLKILKKNKQVKIIFLTEFQQKKLAHGGFAPVKKFIRKNFLFFSDHDLPIIEKRHFDVAFVGRAVEEKGFRLFLSIVKTNPHFKFLAIGGGPLVENLRFGEKIANLELVGQIPHENVGAYLRQTKILLFPSLWYECWPMVIIEAQINGCIVFAASNANIKEIGKDAKGFYFFDIDHPKDISENLQNILFSQQVMPSLSVNIANQAHDLYSGALREKTLLDIYF